MLVLDPIVEVDCCWQILEIRHSNLDVLIVGWNDPRIVDKTAPVGFVIWINLSVQNLHRNKLWCELIDGEVEWDSTIAVWAINTRRTNGVAAFVPGHSESIVMLTCGGWTQVHCVIEITTDCTGLVIDFSPFKDRLFSRTVDASLFDHSEVTQRIRRNIECFESHASGHSNVAVCVSCIKILRNAFFVDDVECCNTSIVLNSVSTCWSENDSIWQTIDSICSSLTSIDSDHLCVFPNVVDGKSPGDFLSFGDVCSRRCLQSDVAI